MSVRVCAYFSQKGSVPNCKIDTDFENPNRPISGVYGLLPQNSVIGERQLKNSDETPAWKNGGKKVSIPWHV